MTCWNKFQKAIIRVNLADQGLNERSALKLPAQAVVVVLITSSLKSFEWKKFQVSAVAFIEISTIARLNRTEWHKSTRSFNKFAEHSLFITTKRTRRSRCRFCRRRAPPPPSKASSTRSRSLSCAADVEQRAGLTCSSTLKQALTLWRALMKISPTFIEL